MKILPPAIAPTKLNYLLQIQKKTEFLPPLSIGEEVVAKVMEKHPSGKMQILLKNSMIIANSKVQLQKGEKVTVTVAQLHPKVILHIGQNKILQNSRLMNYFRFYRSNPKALFEFFTEGMDKLSLKNLEKLATNLGEKDVKDMQSILRSLMFSKESLKNPFFLRDYVEKFGYLMEKGFGEALKKKSNRALNVKNASHNLKGILINMSDRLQSVMETKNLPGVEKLAGFINSSLKTIDTHQVINYQFQEYEGKYMFHIPLLFPGEMGLAEIFVNFRDRNSKDKDNQEKKSTLFLLSMDVLGDVIVEAQIQTKKIDCVFKCEDENVCDFIRPCLVELGEKLMALGYSIDRLKCVTQKNNLKAKSEAQFQNQFSRDNIDIKV